MSLVTDENTPRYVSLDEVKARYGVDPEDALADPDGPLVVTFNGRSYATVEDVERFLRWREIYALAKRVGRGGTRILHAPELGELVDPADLVPVPLPLPK